MTAPLFVRRLLQAHELHGLALRQHRHHHLGLLLLVLQNEDQREHRQGVGHLGRVSRQDGSAVGPLLGRPQVVVAHGLQGLVNQLFSVRCPGRIFRTSPKKQGCA